MRLKKWLAAANTTLWAGKCFPWTTRVTSQRVPYKTHKLSKHDAKEWLTHSTYVFLSLTHLLPQVVHNSHDAGQLSVLLLGGTLPLALLLGAWRLLWGGHPGHVGQIDVKGFTSIDQQHFQHRCQRRADTVSLLSLSPQQRCSLARGKKLVEILSNKKPLVQQKFLLKDS